MQAVLSPRIILVGSKAHFSGTLGHTVTLAHLGTLLLPAISVSLAQHSLPLSTIPSIHWHPHHQRATHLTLSTTERGVSIIMLQFPHFPIFPTLNWFTHWNRFPQPTSCWFPFDSPISTLRNCTLQVQGNAPNQNTMAVPTAPPPPVDILQFPRVPSLRRLIPSSSIGR